MTCVDSHSVNRHTASPLLSQSDLAEGLIVLSASYPDAQPLANAPGSDAAAHPPTHSPSYRVSVVTVSLNNLRGLEATTASIVNQRVRPYEWWVIDGQSSDGTSQFLAGLSYPELRWISEPDAGIYDAMNKGLDRIRGEYVIFLNSGDAFADPSVLFEIKQALHDAPADLLYGDAIECEGTNRCYKPAHSHRRISYSLFTHHQAMVYRVASIAELRYDLSFRMAADWAFTARFLQTQPIVSYLPRPLCLFARGGFSQSPEARSLALAEHVRIHREVLGTPKIAAFFLIEAKRLVNAWRTRFPKLYDAVRMHR